MAAAKVDYSLFFRFLSDFKPGSSVEFIAKIKPKNVSYITEWLASYEKAVSNQTHENRTAKMRAVNPRYVLRNGLVQKIISDCERGDCGAIDAYMQVLARPYEDGTDDQQARFGRALEDDETGIKCSCSS